MPDQTRIAILASGSGSNAEAILRYFDATETVKVAFVGCNRPESQAGIYERTRHLGLETTRFTKAELLDGELLKALQAEAIEWVILAGFLMHIPESFVGAYRGRMLNVHPSLLPKFGGKGMYGMHVHRAVLDAQETESGITVHWVTEAYDEGAVVFQASCSVMPNDTPESLADRVMELEHTYYPRAIAACIADQRTA
ncbi:MAG: phosphoribosylglycinamide formyltransferase [Flavobacteriales bacterium]